MPKDKSGKHHPNVQRAMAADRSGDSKPSAKPAITDGGDYPPAAAPSPVHDHLSAMHVEMGGKHMHVHSDGMKHTTHHVGEDGEVQGPHDHENIEALKQHMDQFLNEEGQEYS